MSPIFKVPPLINFRFAELNLVSRIRNSKRLTILLLFATSFIIYLTSIETLGVLIIGGVSSIIPRVRNPTVFLLLYEFTFIVVLLIILLLGYSFERPTAPHTIMFYSLLPSRPSIPIVPTINKFYLHDEWVNSNLILSYLLLGSPIVKSPAFGPHYWLPVAHVEAPTTGSTIPAGVSLKAGGSGVFYTLKYIKLYIKWPWSVIRVLAMTLTILDIGDLKMMIAYSPTAHITIVPAAIMLNVLVGMKGRLSMTFYHGITPPPTLWLAGILIWFKRRSLIMLKIALVSVFSSVVPPPSIIINTGFPPPTGFPAEVLIIKSVLLRIVLPIFSRLSVLHSCFYNLYLLWGLKFGSPLKINFRVRITDLFLTTVILPEINSY